MSIFFSSDNGNYCGKKILNSNAKIAVHLFVKLTNMKISSEILPAFEYIVYSGILVNCSSLPFL